MFHWVLNTPLVSVIEIMENISRSSFYYHCAKSAFIRSYSGPYSVRMRENADQNNSEYVHFLCSVFCE